MRPYSLDLRERVLADCDAGMSTKQVAEKYRVCAAWVRRLKQRRRETGSIGPKVQRHGPLPRRPEHAEPVAEAIEKTQTPPSRRPGSAMARSSAWRRSGAWSATWA